MSSVMAPLVVEKYPRPQKCLPQYRFFEMREFTLHFVGRPSLHEPHQVTDRQFWRDGYKHVDMVARQHAPDNLDAVLSANLTANVTHSQLNVALQHFIAILGRPNEVVTMVENAMFAREILQVLILLKNEP
jgi:hypothetical protein